jgi:hypothetical protein
MAADWLAAPWHAERGDLHSAASAADLDACRADNRRSACLWTSIKTMDLPNLAADGRVKEIRVNMPDSA